MISICIKDNHTCVQDFLMNKISNSSISNIYYSRHNFRNYQNVIVHYKGDDIHKFYDFLSSTISDAIINFYEPLIVNKLMYRDYFYFEPADKEIILSELKLLEPHMQNTTIYKSVDNYIQEHRAIILDGFVTFRLKDYIDSLNELLEKAVSKFVLNKEYLQFVTLLKEYVDSKIPNPIVINLIYVNNESILLDKFGSIIEPQEFDSEYLSDITFSQNDYALNTLIGELPQRINLHLISPKDDFINTLELIFGNRIKICDDCEICRAYKLLNLN